MRGLGATGLKTPPLVLGGNVFGMKVEREVGFAILDAFVACGGTMIDTADFYSAWAPGNKGGESEAMIGEWLAGRGRRDDVLIATKVGMLTGKGGEGLSASRIAAAAEASLERLRTDYIDLYYAHRDDPATPIVETLEAFDALVGAGKVRHIAASNFTAERLAESLDLSADHGFAAYVALQPEFNLMSRDGYEGALQDLSVERGVGVLSYFGLASGFLTGKYRGAADKAKSMRGGRMDAYLNDHGDAVLAALDAVAADTGATLAQIALAWNAAQPGVTAPIASATSVVQLDELMGALDLRLSEDQLTRLDAASRT